MTTKYEAIMQRSIKRERPFNWNWFFFYTENKIKSPAIFCTTKEEARSFAFHRAREQRERYPNAMQSFYDPIWDEDWWRENILGVVFFSFGYQIIESPPAECNNNTVHWTYYYEGGGYELV